MNSLVVVDMTVRDAVDTTGSLAERGQSVGSLSIGEQWEWLLGMGHMLMGWENVSDMTVMTEARILYTVHKAWKDLHEETVVKWEGDFYKWAGAFTKRRANKEPAKITIDNKIGVYRDWVAEPAVPAPPHIYVPKRDECGALVDKDLSSEGAWDERDFDPMQCDFGKLLQARATAKRGMMSEEAWTALFDPCATVSDLQSAIRDSVEKYDESNENKNATSSNGIDFSFFEQNGLLYVGAAGVVVAFARLLTENKDSPIARRAMQFMLNAIGVKTSALEDELEMQFPIVQIVEDGVIISKGAERIGRFSYDEAAEIVDALQEWING